MTSDNPFLDILQDEEDQNRRRLEGSLSNASRLDPDEFARTRGIADRTGLTPFNVQGNEDELEAAERVNSIDYQSIMNETPALNRFLLDPQRAALVQDEVPFWQQVEQYWQDVEDAFSLGVKQTRVAELRFKQLEGMMGLDQGLTDEEQAEVDGTLFNEGHPADDRGFFAGIPIVTAEQLPLFTRSMLRGVELGFQGAVAGAGAAAIVGQLGPQIATPEEIITVPAAALAGGRAGFITGIALENMKQEAGLAFDEFARFTDIDGNTIDQDIAAAAGLLVGIANGALEFVGDRAVLGSIPGIDKFLLFADRGEVRKLLARESFRTVLKGLAARYARVAAVEGTTEAIQEFITVAGGEIAKAVDAGEFDEVSGEELLSRVQTSFVRGAQGGIGLSTPGIGTQAVIDANRVRRAQQHRTNITERINSILGSNLAGRSDSMLRELYQSVSDTKGQGQVHVSAAPILNQLQTAGQDPVAFFESLGIDQTQLFEAVTTGGDVVVQAGDLLNAVRDNEFKDLVLANVRQDPNAMTALEAEDYVGRIETDATAAVERLNAEAEVVVQMEQRADEVFDSVAEAISAAGVEAISGQRFGVAELYRGMALRQQADWAAEGKTFDPVAFYEGLGLRFRREGFPEPAVTRQVTDPQLSGLLNELRTFRQAGFEGLEREAFGQSISERVREIGVRDDMGDLLAQDVDRDKLPFVRNMLREDGRTLDEIGEALTEEGFFRERPTEAELTDAIINDIGAERREQRIFSEANLQQDIVDRLQGLEGLQEALEQADLDIDELTNEQLISILGRDAVLSPDGETMFHAVWHGSPHKFSEFSLDHVGTGEGAQAFGWGLYFADDRKVAEFYKKQLSIFDDFAKTVVQEETGVELSVEDQKAVLNISNGAPNAELEHAARVLYNRVPALREVSGGERFVDRHIVLERIIERVRGQEPGTLARVDLQPEQDEYLDWDKPLEDQGATVSEAIPAIKELLGENRIEEILERLNADIEELTGNELYFVLQNVASEQELPGQIDEIIDPPKNVSLYLRSIGIPGIRYLDQGSRSEGTGTSNFVIFDDRLIEIQELYQTANEPDDFTIAPADVPRETPTLFQRMRDGLREMFQREEPPEEAPQVDEEAEAAPIRGGIRGDFGKFNSQFEIFITPDMNLSTLLHESGHLFLEVLGREAALPGAPERVKENMQAVLDWLGVEKFEDIVNVHHEQWARTFEVYLREGKAPNARMQRTFDKFRAWLVQVYRRLTGLYDIEITPEIRKIFDTLLASADEVDQAEADNAFRINQEISDLMTESEVAAYFTAAERAHSEAVTETLQRQIRVEQRETKKFWRKQKQKTKRQMTDQVWNENVYQAWHFLTKGEFFERETPDDIRGTRVNRQKLIDTFETEGILQDMPRTVPPMWAKEGGLHPDELAEMVGYNSGFELFTDIINAERPLVRIDRLTDESMQRNNPVPDIAEDALEATFNDQRALFLSAELKALRRQAGEEFMQDVIGRAARSPLGVMRNAVQRVLETKPLREVTKPFVFLNNSQRAARRAQQAIVDEDFQTAAREKSQQLFNFLMFREALKARDKSAQITKRLRSAANKRIDPNIVATEYIAAIKDISKGVLNPTDVNMVAAMRTSVEFAKGQEVDPDNPANLVIPAMFEGDYDVRSIRDMTFSELQSVDAMIKSLREEGRRRGDEVRFEFEQRDVALADQVRANVKRVSKSPMGKSSSRQAIEDGFGQYMAGQVKATQFFREMDGFVDQGLVWSTFMGRAVDMENAETIMLEDKLPQLRELFDKHFSRADLAKSMWRKIRLGDFGALTTITKQQLLSLALNFGNQDNIDALAEGYNVDPEALFAAIDQALTADEWQFVQETWDFIDGFWPDIKTLEERVTGVIPPKVQPLQVNSRHGMFKGGYYPLQYDERLSVRADANQAAEKFKLMAGGQFSRATTKHGHTKERVGSGGQAVKLDLDVVFRHVNDVIHDLTHREGIIELNRLMNGRQFIKSISETFGADVHRNLRNWLVDIGAGQIQPAAFLDKMLRRVRIGTTVVTMGFSFSTMAVQILGFASTLVRLGGRRTVRGVGQFYKNPRAGWKFVFESSPFMRKRFNNFDRDVQAFASSVTRTGVTQEIANIAFKGIGFMDLMVSMPTWLGAYEQGMELFEGDHVKASRHADAVVAESQGAGTTKDLAAIMRGSEGARLFTMFMSYFSAMHNLLRENVVQLRNGGISPARFALHMLYLVILPPIIEGLARGEEPDEDDNEAWVEWAARKIGGYSFSTLVGIRDIANLWSTDYGFGFSPVAQTLKAGFEGTKALVTAEDTTNYQVRQAVTLFGVLTRTPTKKVYDQFDYWMKVLENEEDLTVRGVIFNKRER